MSQARSETPPAAVKMNGSVEFAAISAPRFPILLHAGGCNDDSCETPAKTCALAHAFQLDAKLALQSEEPNDNTVSVYLNLVARFSKLRTARFVSEKLISDKTLIRGIFFDAFSGNAAAYRLLKMTNWPNAIKNAFKKAFAQLDTFGHLCSLTENPKVLEVISTPSFYPFAGVISWADLKSISATVDRKLPENDLKVTWPLIPETPPLSARMSRIGNKTRVILFSSGRELGSVNAVRDTSTNEIELIGIPQKLRSKITEIGKQYGVVAVANRASLSDKDDWKSIKLTEATSATILKTLKNGKISLGKQAFFSAHLNQYLVRVNSEGEIFSWFKIDQKAKPLDQGFEPLIAADFLNRGHSQWLGRNKDGEITVLDLSAL